MKTCEICKKEFLPKNKHNKNRVCSRSCRGILARSYYKGSPNWKGDKAGYSAIHKWLAANFEKTGTCEECGKSGLKGRKVQWANISGEYKRDREDYKLLCNRCHYHLDKKLRKEDVAFIRKQYIRNGYKGNGGGITQQKLADMFGISRSNISSIINNRYWNKEGYVI